MILLVDNYDSFSYNLYQLIGSVNTDVQVVRNDAVSLEEIEKMAPEAIVLSQGPGRPEDAGICIPVIKEFAGKIPILGVCLGHQAIGEVFGARLTNLAEVFHGVATEGTNLQRDYIFRDLPPRITMGRYHSWVVERSSLPACLEVTAESDEGFVMALRHRDYDVHGIQFHPESVLTPQGATIVSNWLKG